MAEIDLAESSFWETARGQMLLDPTVTNLNSGSWGPLPRCVFEHVTELRRCMAEEPMNFFVRLSPDLLWDARERMAAFLNGDPKRLIFTANVSSAINIVAAGLTLSGPGEILLTDHEYGAMHWCWERVAQRHGLALRTFPLPLMAQSPQEIVDAACAAFSPRTRLLFFSHVLSPTGLVLPAEQLCAEARQRGILTVIDGAHAPAMVTVDVTKVNADFYAGNSHKWLLAPNGSGFLAFGRDAIDRIQPLHVSWGYRYEPRRADDRDEWGCTYRIRSLEFEGFRDVSPWIATPTAVEFQARLGWDRIRGRIAGLAEYVRSKMDGLRGLKLTTSSHPELHGALTAFRLPTGVQTRALQQELWASERIETAAVDRPEAQILRVSTHWYNTTQEIDKLCDALKRCATLP
jgi:isopenicillin-N epimerase